eukprot:CAMPEP_0180027510 /NCGR_PEP_ID=MMETSP0984-20121128/25779_1 /TAXON_ID=483367 /ORGANISM="non described non described, Strain CCMP 2436" /LENGTH=54 /DNA_ID=CAMNT_0021952317 /DNA_START=156 /DNA_END=317 /DNA_ORIENTATION=-
MTLEPSPQPARSSAQVEDKRAVLVEEFSRQTQSQTYHPVNRLIKPLRQGLSKAA